jgi:hypothetical protein
VRANHEHQTGIRSSSRHAFGIPSERLHDGGSALVQACLSATANFSLFTGHLGFSSSCLALSMPPLQTQAPLVDGKCFGRVSPAPVGSKTGAIIIEPPSSSSSCCGSHGTRSQHTYPVHTPPISHQRPCSQPRPLNNPKNPIRCPPICNPGFP